MLLKVFEVQTSGIKHRIFKRGQNNNNNNNNKVKKKKNGGNLIWQMQNFANFGRKLIWWIIKNVKFSRTLIC